MLQLMTPPMNTNVFPPHRRTAQKRFSANSGIDSEARSKRADSLKELFLQQRPPRFVLTGSHPMPLLEFVGRISPRTATGRLSRETLTVSIAGKKIMLASAARFSSWMRAGRMTPRSRLCARS